MFWRGGPTPTADFNVNLLAASTLGGGPTVNWSNCLRTPAWVREQWARESGLEGVDGPEFDRHLDAVWRRLGVNDRCSDLNGPHERMRDGAAALNWSFKTASRNADPARYSPESAGHIGFGDRTGAKRDVRQTYLHDAVAAGARVIVGCRAERVLVEGGVAAGVRTTSGLTVRARRVVVACGSLESPALLLRSGIGGPAVGRHLHLHPTTAFMGFYAGGAAGLVGRADERARGRVRERRGRPRLPDRERAVGAVDHRRRHRPLVGAPSTRRRWRGSATPPG